MKKIARKVQIRAVNKQDGLEIDVSPICMRLDQLEIWLSEIVRCQSIERYHEARTDIAAIRRMYLGSQRLKLTDIDRINDEIDFAMGTHSRKNRESNEQS